MSAIFLHVCSLPLVVPDLKNEPHGNASWGTGNVSTDFNLFAERAITTLGQTYPNWKGLFVVEGISNPNTTNSQYHSPYRYWWGRKYRRLGSARIFRRHTDVLP